MTEPRKARPRGADVVIQPSDPMHPGDSGRPAIAMAMYVSPADQQWIDDVRERSYRLAVERLHIRS